MEKNSTRWQEFQDMVRQIAGSWQRDSAARRYQKWVRESHVYREIQGARLRSKARVGAASSWRPTVKRILDIMVSLAGLVIASPLMILMALAIKFDSKGPVFYRQVRVGKKGGLFKMLKFRTMNEDAEKNTGPIWAKKGDPRVTRMGFFLRRAHLDELPQLLNVLKGEMSVVGPRPERPYFVNEFRRIISHYDRRLCAKPGLTGLAQIKRSYDETLEDVKKKLRYDVLYIEKMCPFLDMKIIALTIGAVLLRTGR